MNFLDAGWNSGGVSAYRPHTRTYANDFDRAGNEDANDRQIHSTTTEPGEISLLGLYASSFDLPSFSSEPVLVLDQPLYADHPYPHADLEKDIIDNVFPAEPQPVPWLETPPADNELILTQGQLGLLFEEYFPAEPQPAPWFETPPADNELTLTQGQQNQPLHVDDIYQLLPTQPPVAELQDNINTDIPHTEPNRELELSDIQLHHPVAEPQENIEAPHIQPDRESELVDIQHHHPVESREGIVNAEGSHTESNQEPDLQLQHPPAIPAISVHGIEKRPGQEFRCGNRCRGKFTGPHKCSYRGRSLTILCHGNKGDCPSKFSKKSDFGRHCRTVHNGKKLWSCPVVGCERVGEKAFTRKDNLTQHRRNVHEERIAKNPVRFGRV